MRLASSMIWKLEEAKNRFSELVRRARQEGPQVVTKHGREAVVVMDVEEYRSLTDTAGGLADFLSASPLGEAVRSGELTIERRRDFGRDVDL